MSELFAAFGINWKLLLVQAFNFGLLLAVLTYFLYKPVLKLIDERREKIAEGVRTAEAAARRLEEAKSEGDKRIGEASREAESLVATARTRAEEKGAEIVKAAEARAASTLKDAQARAEEAQRQALRESSKEIARAAMLAAEKILREKSA
ncbi:ATP synthase F0 subunit B [Candidatus Kaiserbacteria bacterium RIFCSPHIGHO2_01_FULL_55_17]|uniref:ATP synthase subunit b n=1 Tax=Candidatus Kaiserbacteria bacterium RIFCSPHIGHO2_01_FULL_55_17 TaxID=1798484 RepID=A0A1F6D799_9BACT|nr:MAG: ATP synthase F0 subunit B [Candidatus Kaiserbacteria bacterium RIFCSPHIGHO2_01_FULL_55_17]